MLAALPLARTEWFCGRWGEVLELCWGTRLQSCPHSFEWLCSTFLRWVGLNSSVAAGTGLGIRAESEEQTSASPAMAFGETHTNSTTAFSVSAFYL